MRLINIVEERWATVSSARCWSGAFVVFLPGHASGYQHGAVLDSKLSFIKGSLLTGRVCLGETSRSPARMSRLHLRAQGTINKVHVWVLAFAMETCASFNNHIGMPESRSADGRTCGQTWVWCSSGTSGAVDIFKTCIIRRWSLGFNRWNPLIPWFDTLYQQKLWTFPSLLTRQDFQQLVLRRTWPSLTPFRESVQRGTLASRNRR